MAPRKLPPHVQQQLELVHMLIMSGDVEEAELTLDPMIEAHPDVPLVAFLQGLLESAHGVLDAVTEHYLRAAELDPDDPQWLLVAATELLRVVEDAPSEDFVRQGVDPRTLALFEGTLVAERAPSEKEHAVPDALVLFLRNFEHEVSFQSMRDFAPDRAALKELVHGSLVSETKRFFGLDD